MRVTIVGLGLIGGSLALDLRGRGFASRVIGVDSNALNQKRALELGLVNECLPFEEAIPHSDLVILAIPVNGVALLLPRVLDLASAQTTITDMGSTKDGICQAVSDHAKRSQFVASHPMAGTENSGPNAAQTGLFSGKTAVICDRNKSGAIHMKRVEEMYRVLDMRISHMTAVEHDLHVAYVSHLSHISSFVLANTVLAKEKDAGTVFDLAGGGFESTVRLAKSSPEMWSPIFEQNRTNVIGAIDSYMDHLLEFKKALADESWKEARELMENANKIRRVLENISSKQEKK